MKYQNGQPLLGLVPAGVLDHQSQTNFQTSGYSTLSRALSRTLPDHLQLGVATSAFLSDITVVDPDLSIFPRMNTREVRGPDILLAIEVADTTLAKDLHLKAGVYAKYGVRELWVIDANKRVTHVFRDPIAGAWTQLETHDAEHALTHASAPGFLVRLGEL